MTSPVEAEQAIRAHAPRLPSVTLPLTQLAGAILREPIVCSRDQPPFDRVTMDGIAFAYSSYAAGRREFRIAGTQAAGAAPLALTDSQTCIEVMTGAPVPAGCDCVVPVEKIVVRDDTAQLTADAAPLRDANVHARALDCRRGDRLLEPGQRLGPPEVAVIAAAGLPTAQVSRAPRIVVISTGDELIEPGNAVEDWQIYRSNAYAVVSALQRRGFAAVAHDHLPDRLDTLRARLSEHLREYDVLIMSGGVSMGRFDYVPQVLAELGVKVVFHKIDQRPGRPMWFGVSPAGRAVYALPGNPVSTLICLTRYVYAGLDAAMQAAPRAPEMAPLAEDFEVKPALTFFLPVKLDYRQGSAAARPRPTQGSGDFTSLIDTDGFVELPPGPTVVSRGTATPLYRW
jgi:molybdopterin molybdotransferase